MSWNATYVRTRPWVIPLANDHKKLPACLLVWVWGSTLAAFGRKEVPLIYRGCLFRFGHSNIAIVGHRVKYRLDDWTLGPLDCWTIFWTFFLDYFLDHFLDQFLRLLIVGEGWVGHFHHLLGGGGGNYNTCNSTPTLQSKCFWANAIDCRKL